MVNVGEIPLISINTANGIIESCADYNRIQCYLSLLIKANKGEV